ncbi:hypothetical protein B0H13DRAFT_1893502 [Mycena leptocephala]|nr:hypothetical protein B0H13DRAFT_1893502 [Mycena leptocephala]
MAGCWCLGHEAGHGNISKYGVINDTVGYFLHTVMSLSFSLPPHPIFRLEEFAPHAPLGSIERDENYVPRTRSELGVTTTEQLHEMFEETPFCLGSKHTSLQPMGCPRDPPGTNHFSPSSVLFKKKEYNKIIASDVGLLLFSSLLVQYSWKSGFAALLKHYIVPYLLCHHWIVMLTFLHHSDPTIPHYRAGQWTFLRGALATVDRPLLGWIGRMYFHNDIDLFGADNQPALTEKLKTVLGNTTTMTRRSW